MHRKAMYRIALTTFGTGAALAVTTGAFPAHGVAGDGWQSVGKGMTSGVSGAVTMGRTDDGGLGTLVVRDNKKPGENRIAEVSQHRGQKPHVEPLDWHGSDLPVDLEAIDEVPGEHSGYVAVTSEGTAYHVKLANGAAKVLDTFRLPAKEKGDNIENFALHAPSAPSPGAPGKLAAVWGDRGDDSRPGTLHAASLTLGKEGGARFGDVQSSEIRAPYPSRDVRHASDLKVSESGSLLVSSASDPGDDGPFDSAVYTAGHVSLSDSGTARLSTTEDPGVLKKFRGHKIEALDCLPNSDDAVLGTDDEKGGGSLTTASGICGH